MLKNKRNERKGKQGAKRNEPWQTLEEWRTDTSRENTGRQLEEISLSSPRNNQRKHRPTIRRDQPKEPKKQAQLPKQVT